MIVYPLFNGVMYYAVQKNRAYNHKPEDAFAFIGRGISRDQAISNCLKVIRREWVKLPVHDEGR